MSATLEFDDEEKENAKQSQEHDKVTLSKKTKEKRAHHSRTSTNKSEFSEQYKLIHKKCYRAIKASALGMPRGFLGFTNLNWQNIINLVK